jgi:hypothetical protein
VGASGGWWCGRSAAAACAVIAARGTWHWLSGAADPSSPRLIGQGWSWLRSEEGTEDLAVTIIASPAAAGRTTPAGSMPSTSAARKVWPRCRAGTGGPAPGAALCGGAASVASF